MPGQLLLVLLLVLVFSLYNLRVEAVNGLADKGTKDEPLPKDNPLDYARSKGAAVGTLGTKATSKGVLGKAKPVAGKTKPAPAIKKATGTATAAGKSKPAPLDESAYITNVNSIGEEDPSGKKRDKITATTAVPSESTTIAPSMGKL